MGISSSNTTFIYYGEACHPLLGKVTAYSIKGQAGKFMMKTQTRATSALQLELIDKIGQSANHRLVGYFGCHPQHALLQDKLEVQMLWELLNYDLSQEISYLRIFQKPMDQDLIWQILACLVEASKFLQTFHIYPELELGKIQFSAAKEPKLFWADIQPQNMHRAYEQYLKFHKFRRAFYSPEELIEITRQKNKNIDKQKCVVFNMGLIALECASRKSIETIYDYGNRALSEVKKRQILNEVASQYSTPLSEVLLGCLEYFPKSRYDYSNLQGKINAHLCSSRTDARKLQPPQYKEQQPQIYPDKKASQTPQASGK